MHGRQSVFEDLMKARTPIDPEEELALFVYRVFREGVYVLPCGGGVISEPREAIDRLAGWYDRDDLKRLCLEIVRRNAEPYGLDLPEGVWGTVTGILDHLPYEDLSNPWKRRLEHVSLLILAVLFFPIVLYFWWRERQDERRWLKRHRSEWAPRQPREGDPA
jgi:hypothetical protein